MRSVHQVMLFTYTDRDGFIPPSDKADSAGGSGVKLTTGDGGPPSYLAEAVTNMCRKGASSGETAAAGGGGGDGGGTTAGVSETAAVIQTHLAREDKFKARKSTC